MSRPRFVLLCAAILLGALVLAEVLARWRAQLRYGDVQDVYELFEPVPGSDLLRPIPGLDTVFGGGRVRIDSRGFRSPELAPEPVERSLRLAFLGGSTTFGSNLGDNTRTWPARATAALQDALPDHLVEHVNAGVTGYGVEHSTRALALRLGDVDPDVIVIYHATNDLARDSERLALEQGLVERDPEPGWLERHSFLWMLVRKNQRYLAAQAAGRATTAKLDAAPSSWSAGFAERLRTLVRAAQARSERVVLLTFSTLARADQREDVQLDHLAQSFTFMPYLTPSATLAAYAEYNDVIRAVAAETGALLVDVAETIPGDRAHFHDTVHLSEQGCAVLGARVAEALLGDGLFRALVGVGG